MYEDLMRTEPFFFILYQPAVGAARLKTVQAQPCPDSPCFNKVFYRIPVIGPAVDYKIFPSLRAAPPYGLICIDATIALYLLQTASVPRQPVI